MTTNKKNEVCPRCNGSGYLPQYGHVENGICFRCRGNGKYYLHQRKQSSYYRNKNYENRSYNDLCSNEELSGWGGVDFDTWFALK
jgi:DnaJ-class molecular chaperone